MLDDYGKKQAKDALESALEPLVQKNGGPLPKGWIRCAVNQDTQFPGQGLALSPDTAAPNAQLFQELRSKIRLVSTALLRQTITADKLDIAAVLDILPPGLVI